MVTSSPTMMLIWVFILAVFILSIWLPIYIRNKIVKQIKALADNSLEMTPKEFFNMRNTTLGGKGNPKIALAHDFTGVYILFNKSKNMYYVGQSVKVISRVNAHLTGKGNGDVYADYKYGDEFTIKMIGLTESSFSSLNELERKTILTYDGYSKGYNKNRGNRN